MAYILRKNGKYMQTSYFNYSFERGDILRYEKMLKIMKNRKNLRNYINSSIGDILSQLELDYYEFIEENNIKDDLED